MDGGALWAAVHVILKSQTLLSNFTFTFHLYALEKEMATHSSVLAWTELGQESQTSSCVEESNSAWLSRCSWGDRPLVDLYVELAGFSGRCTGVSLPLRVVPWSTGLPSSWVLPSCSYQERTRELGSFGMPHDPRGYVSNFLVTTFQEMIHLIYPIYWALGGAQAFWSLVQIHSGRIAFDSFDQMPPSICSLNFPRSHGKEVGRYQKTLWASHFYGREWRKLRECLDGVQISEPEGNFWPCCSPSGPAWVVKRRKSV